MSYGESISLKLVNNTDQPQRIGLLGGTASTYANSNNNVVVQWDLSGETYTGSTVVLGTTLPAEQPLLTASIVGVVDALNLMNKGVFTYSGNIVYANTLTDNSVETANLTLQIGNLIPQIVTFRFSDTNPDTAIGKYTLGYIKQLFNDKCFKIVDKDATTGQFCIGDFAFPADGYSCISIEVGGSGSEHVIFDNGLVVHLLDNHKL